MLYTNDLANGSLSENCFSSLNADDMLVYKIITDPGDYTSLQSDIVVDWMNEHYLSLNPLKCKRMIVTRLRQHSVSTPTLLLNWEPVENVNRYKYLGATLTSGLTWSDHIRNMLGCYTDIQNTSFFVLSHSLLRDFKCFVQNL